MRKTITLIQLPNPQLNEPKMYFPLGILYIAAVLEEAGHDARVVDLRDESISLDHFENSDFFGITATTAEIRYAKSLSKMLKDRYPKSVTILGGAHATHLPNSCIDAFDCVVQGEGEKAILEIVQEGKSGVIFSEEIEDLDSIPFPARHLIPPETFISESLFAGSRYGKSPPATTLIGTRGCPFSCAFCPNLPVKVRYRSPGNISSEIRDMIKKYGCKHFRFEDDNFTLNKEHLIKVCGELGPLNIHYKCHTRSALLDEEMCESLVNSGCKEMGLGVETADDYVLKLVNKKESVEDHFRAISLIKKFGMRAKVYWMVGLPGETWETIEKNKDFMRRAKPDKWTLSTFTPYPGCDIWKQPDRYGVKILTLDWDKYWNFPDSSVIETDVASNNELNQHRDEFYKFLISEVWRNG